MVLLMSSASESLALGSGYFGKMFRTEKRGFTNVVTGFFEAPLAIQEAHGESVSGVQYGEAALKGGIRAGLRTASGLWDIPAGFIPGLQGGFPLNPETLFRK